MLVHLPLLQQGAHGGAPSRHRARGNPCRHECRAGTADRQQPARQDPDIADRQRRSNLRQPRHHALFRPAGRRALSIEEGQAHRNRSSGSADRRHQRMPPVDRLRAPLSRDGKTAPALDRPAVDEGPPRSYPPRCRAAENRQEALCRPFRACRPHRLLAASLRRAMGSGLCGISRLGLQIREAFPGLPGHEAASLTTPGLAPFDIASLHEIDESAQGRRQLPAARIIEEEAGIIGAPILQDADQSAVFQSWQRVIFKQESKAGAINRGVEHHVEIAERQRPLYLDFQFDTSTFEFPAIIGAAWKTVADARVIFQVVRRDRFRETLKMFGRADDRRPLTGADGDGYHIGGDTFAEPDPSVETAGDRVHQRIVHHDLHFHVGIGAQEL
ncbi:hypothetical protein RHSP_18226 [Rhizobium freirei PRF 81]|uniref:Uncharacterized protein n=1 Tax=Rhizobium freirei PRF 81 TaxID=363754 RepID=N6UVX0_9HYPH|nr:hypothetical protein RHSP_18226 [Rhizobium freirei PRF 81]